jgi:hypothetical protein
VAVVLIVVLAALLRADAIVAKWGLLDGPPWARAIEETAASAGRALRPVAFNWLPEAFLWGDPYDDLENARQMRSFYQGSYREPVFVFATKVFQGLVGDQEQVVVLASGLFSTLAVWATFLVGASAFSWWVGAGAALALAAERDVIGAGVIGSRDDAFVALVLLFAYAFLRARDEPTWQRGAFCGLAGAAACLTRVTGLSLVLPGLAYLALVPGRQSLRPLWTATAAATLTLTVAFGPFLLYCWWVYGDPLYSINTLTSWYTLRTGASEAPGSSLGYLSSAVAQSPFAYVETVVAGVTTYQHQYKWTGFDPWLPGLGRALQWLSIPGVFLMLGSPPGRALVALYFCAMLPFVFTWTTPGLGRVDHFRFTQATYPLLLMAAALSIVTVAAMLRGLVPRLSFELYSTTTLKRATAAAAGMLAMWFVLTIVPVLRMEEDLDAGRGIVVQAGGFDRAFFRAGWHPAGRSGNVTARFSRGRTGRVYVPMAPHRHHRVTLRIDPFAAGGETVDRAAVLVNGRTLAVLDLPFDPNRIGEYVVEVPADAVTGRVGWVEVRVTSTRPGVAGAGAPGFSGTVRPDQEVGFLLWAVLVEPIGA